jgi:DNA-binding transcriptional ArsR family regulator
MKFVPKINLESIDAVLVRVPLTIPADHYVYITGEKLVCVAKTLFEKRYESELVPTPRESVIATKPERWKRGSVNGMAAQRFAVLRSVSICRPSCTKDEIREAISNNYGKVPASISARLVELEREGYISVSRVEGQRQVYSLTEKAVDFLTTPGETE